MDKNTLRENRRAHTKIIYFKLKFHTSREMFPQHSKNVYKLLLFHFLALEIYPAYFTQVKYRIYYHIYLNWGAYL